MKRHAREKNGEHSRNDGIQRTRLSLVYGGLHVPRALTPEQYLDRGFREICASCKVRRESGTLGGYACRAVADVAQGLRFPLRIVARMIAAVLANQGPCEFGERIGHLLIEYNARKACALGRTIPPKDTHRQAAA